MITFLCGLTTSLVGRKIRQVSERAEAKETNDKLSALALSKGHNNPRSFCLAEFPSW